ncbi:MAG: Gfo/Idh/MocA family oxidoreductase [Chloroflexota bacterium]|nr:Gfo/Idh/MocA family oxidoreductase [Chloroflexota bacterium]
MSVQEEEVSQPLRVGVVGLGFAGETHTKSYANLPGVKVHALAGLEAEKLAQLGETHDIPHLYRDWQDLLARDDLDAVSVCTPNFLHAPIAIAALEGGRHVLCEKPLARSSAEAESMVNAAISAGRVLQTAFNHRQRGDVQQVKRFIDEGLLGRVYHAKARWMRRNGIPGLGSWFTSKELAGGGPLIDLGVHVLDQALFLLGEPRIVSVSAAAYAELGPRGRGFRGAWASQKMQVGSGFEVEDFGTAFMRADDGTTLLLDASWAVYGSAGDDFGLTLYGTDGGAEIDVKWYGWENTLRVFLDVAGSPVEVRPQSERGGGHQAVVQKFVDTIRSGDWASHTGQEGLARARIVEACYTSAREGREVSLETAQVPGAGR